jgi:hypothetical protein
VRKQGHGGVGEHRWRAWKLLGGSVREVGGRRRGLRSTAKAVAVLGHGGGSPVRQGEDGWARELLWSERVPFPGSIGAERGRRWKLDSAGTAGGHGGEQRRAAAPP